MATLLDDLRQWAAENWKNNVDFWVPFADRVNEIYRQCGGDSEEWKQAKALYETYENDGDNTQRQYEFERWMG